MSTVSIPNQIQAGQPLDPRPVMANFDALASFINDDVLTLDGSKAMTGHLKLSGPGTADGHAVTKAQLDGFLPLSGGTVTGDLQVNGTATATRFQIPTNDADNVVLKTYLASGYQLMQLQVGASWMEIAGPDSSGRPNTISMNTANSIAVRFDNNQNTRLYGDLQVDGHITTGAGKAVYFGGNWDGARIFNTTAAGREYMIYGNVAGGGTQMTMYGPGDSSTAGNLYLYSGGAITARFDKNKDTKLYGDLQVDGQTKAQNGTKAKPAYSFTSDPDTGIYRYSEGILSISANGVDAGNFGTDGVAFPTVPYSPSRSRNLHMDPASGALVRTADARFGDDEIEKLVKFVDDLSAKLGKVTDRLAALEGQKGL